MDEMGVQMAKVASAALEAADASPESFEY